MRGRFGIVFVMVMGLSLSARAMACDCQGKADATPEERQKMAEAHQKLADCLKSTRPASECHAEMHAEGCKGHEGGSCGGEHHHHLHEGKKKKAKKS